MIRAISFKPVRQWLARITNNTEQINSALRGTVNVYVAASTSLTISGSVTVSSGTVTVGGVSGFVPVQVPQDINTINQQYLTGFLPRIR